MSLGQLIVAEPRPKKGRSIAVVGGGSPTAYLFYLIATIFSAFELAHELLGGILGNWNQEDSELYRRIPNGVRFYAPRKTLPGLPQGFRSDGRLCASTRHYWLPFYESAFRELRRESVSGGMTGGLVIHILTCGGHLPQAYDIVRLAKEHFPSPDTLHIGLFFLPSKDRGLWKNLRFFPGFPDDLGIPLIIADNRFRQQIDWAVPVLLATLVYAKYIDRSQHSILELFDQTHSRHRLLGLAAAHSDLPIVGFDFLYRTWRTMQGKTAWGLAAPELLQRVPEVLANVLQDDAKLIASPPFDPREVQFTGVGGLPLPETRDPRVIKDERANYQSTVEKRLEARLADIGQMLPPGNKVVWAHGVMNLPDQYTRIPAVRVFPIPGRTARTYVEELLAEDSWQMQSNHQLPPSTAREVVAGGKFSQ